MDEDHVPEFSIRSLVSGSSGNALLIRRGARSVMLDAGLGPRKLVAALAGVGCDIRGLAGLIVSHEHIDHVRSVPYLQQRGVPLYTSEGTAHALGCRRGAFHAAGAGSSFEVIGIRVTPIAVSHDAAEPLGFRFEVDGIRVLVATDLGEPPTSMVEEVAAADLVVIESNHDREMLRDGPYPPHLKRRVASKYGHLSNDDCGYLLGRALKSTTRAREIWLAHLSQTNNRPALAEQTSRGAVALGGISHRVIALPRHEPGPEWIASARERHAQLPLLDA